MSTVIAFLFMLSFIKRTTQYCKLIIGENDFFPEGEWSYPVKTSSNRLIIITDNHSILLKENPIESGDYKSYCYDPTLTAPKISALTELPDNYAVLTTVNTDSQKLNTTLINTNNDNMTYIYDDSVNVSVSKDNYNIGICLENENYFVVALIVTTGSNNKCMFYRFQYSKDYSKISLNKTLNIELTESHGFTIGGMSLVRVQELQKTFCLCISDDKLILLSIGDGLTNVKQKELNFDDIINKTNLTLKTPKIQVINDNPDSYVISFITQNETQKNYQGHTLHVGILKYNEDLKKANFITIDELKSENYGFLVDDGKILSLLYLTLTNNMTYWNYYINDDNLSEQDEIFSGTKTITSNEHFYFNLLNIRDKHSIMVSHLSGKIEISLIKKSECILSEPIYIKKGLSVNFTSEFNHTIQYLYLPNYFIFLINDKIIYPYQTYESTDATTIFTFGNPSSSRVKYMNKGIGSDLFSNVCSFKLIYCHHHCQTCEETLSEEDKDKCTSCIAHQTYPMSNVDTSSETSFLCFSKEELGTNSGYYLENDTAFKQCYSSCETCFQGSEMVNEKLIHYCNICKKGYYKKESDDDNEENYNCYTKSEAGNNYYLDNEFNKFMKCYESCQECFTSGNDITHNCNTCKEGYEKNHKEPSLCFPVCDEYWYLEPFDTPLSNDVKKKTCVSSCLEINTTSGDYSYVIDHTKQCTKECDVFIDQDILGCSSPLLKYQNEELIHCVSECPSSPKHEVQDGFCVKVQQGGNIGDNNNPNDSGNNSTIPDDSGNNSTIPDDNPDDNTTNPGTEANDSSRIIYKKSIRNDDFTTYNIDTRISQYKSILKTEEDIAEETINLIYTEEGKDFTATFNKLSTLNSLPYIYDSATQISLQSIKDLGLITDNEDLLIVTVDAHRPTEPTDQVEYIFYKLPSYNKIDLKPFEGSTNNKKLELTYVLHDKIINQTLMNLDMIMESKGIDIYNKEDPFYNDICFLFTSNYSRDVTIEDRRTYYYPQTSFCENNCTLITLDFENEKVKCNCSLKTTYSKEIKPNDETQSLDKKKVENVKVLGCFKTIFNDNIFIQNIPFWVFSFISALQVVFIAWGLCSGTTFLKEIELSSQNNTPREDDEQKLKARQQAGAVPNPPKKNNSNDETEMNQDSIYANHQDSSIREKEIKVDIEGLDFDKLEDCKNIIYQTNIGATKENNYLDLNKKLVLDDHHNDKSNQSCARSNSELIDNNGHHHRRRNSNGNSSNNDSFRKHMNEDFYVNFEGTKILKRGKISQIKKEENIPHQNEEQNQTLKKMEEKKKTFSCCKHLWQFFAKRESLIFAISNNRLYYPSFILWTMFLITLCLSFSFHCLLFTTKYVHNRFLKKKITTSFFFSNELDKCFFAALIIFVIKTLLRKVFVYCLFKMHKKDLPKVKAKELACKTRGKLAVFIIMAFIFTIGLSYICIGYGGVLINSTEALFLGMLVTYIFAFIVVFIFSVIYTIIKAIVFSSESTCLYGCYKCMKVVF